MTSICFKRRNDVFLNCSFQINESRLSVCVICRRQKTASRVIRKTVNVSYSDWREVRLIFKPVSNSKNCDRVSQGLLCRKDSRFALFSQPIRFNRQQKGELILLSAQSTARLSRMRRARWPGLSDLSNSARTKGASVSCASRVVLLLSFCVLDGSVNKYRSWQFCNNIESRSLTWDYCSNKFALED